MHLLLLISTALQVIFCSNYLELNSKYNSIEDIAVEMGLNNNFTQNEIVKKLKFEFISSEYKIEFFTFKENPEKQYFYTDNNFRKDQLFFNSNLKAYYNFHPNSLALKIVNSSDLPKGKNFYFKITPLKQKTDDRPHVFLMTLSGLKGGDETKRYISKTDCYYLPAGEDLGSITLNVFDLGYMNKSYITPNSSNKGILNLESDIFINEKQITLPPNVFHSTEMNLRYEIHSNQMKSLHAHYNTLKKFESKNRVKILDIEKITVNVYIKSLLNQFKNKLHPKNVSNELFTNFCDNISSSLLYFAYFEENSMERGLILNDCSNIELCDNLINSIFLSKVSKLVLTDIRLRNKIINLFDELIQVIRFDQDQELQNLNF